MTASVWGRLFNTKELQIWVQQRRRVLGVDGPLTLASICHSSTLKLMWCLTQRRDEVKQGNADSPLWILTFRDFSSCCFALIRTQPAKVPLKSENSECFVFGTVIEGLLRPRHKPKRTSRAVKPTLHIWTHSALCLLPGSMMSMFLSCFRKESDRLTFLVVFLLNVSFCSVLQRVNVVRVWLEDFAAHCDGSASLLTLVRTQTATLFVSFLWQRDTTEQTLLSTR